jgi:predicted AAA+ superfamily ATPase
VLVPKTTGLLNKASIQKEANINKETCDNYLSLLQNVYQLHSLKPYSENISKSFVKSPKLYLTDSGLFAHMLDIHSVSELLSSRYKGNIIETFVFSELLKHKTYSYNNYQIMHYRTNDQKECDFIIQSVDEILACEVKSASHVSKDDFKHIVEFQKKSSKNIKGIVFYFGADIVTFGKNLYAVPMSLFF